MRRNASKRTNNHERMIFTIPQPVAEEIRQYADAVRGANKSGFVADAVRWYVDYLRRVQRTAKLRQSYAQAAERSLQICKEWEPLDGEVSARLDELEAQQAKAN